MHVRCPHCHNPIEMIGEASFSDVTCPSCGSHVNLIFEETTAPYPANGARRLGHFELIEQVGYGHFGTVWKARDCTLQRTVAVKIPRRGQLTVEETEFFFRDARAAAQFQHPSIVSVHEVGRDGDTVFIASDFIEGANLKEWLTARRPTHREATVLMIQIAEAVQHAHERGVIHRDLKPGNILMDPHGDPHVTDFGLAKRESGEITMTVEGQILGTPAYMSPEQAQGNAHAADARSDVYALGVILFELLTGELPFRGENRMLIMQILHDEPPSPRKLQSRLPRDLETICLKALSKEPSKRYSTAQKFADELRRHLAGEPILARPVSRTERTWRWCRRKPLVAGLSATVAILLVGVTVASLFVAQSLSFALGETLAAQRSARLREGEALINEAQGRRLSRYSGQRFASLAALRQANQIGKDLNQPPEWISRVRNEAAAAIILPDIHVAKSWSGFPSDTRWAAPSEDLQWYVRTSQSGEIAVHRVSDQSIVTQLPTVNDELYASFGVGRILYVIAKHTHQFWIWDLSNGNAVSRLHERNVLAYDAPPRGVQIVLQYVDGSARVLDTASWSQLHALPPAQKNAVDSLLHPSEPYMIEVKYGESKISLRDLRSGARIADTGAPAGSGAKGHGVWSPDGKFVVVPDTNGRKIEVYAFSAVDEPHLRLMRELEVAPTSSGGALALSFNAIGDRIVGRGWTGAMHLWDWQSGKLVFSSAGMGSSLQLDLSWNTTDEHIGLALVGERKDQLGICSIADGREIQRIHAPIDFINSQQSVHPNGRLLALGSAYGIVVCDLLTGQVVVQEKIPRAVMNVQFAENGDLFTYGGSGAIKWPVQIDPTAPERISIGPPVSLPFVPGKGPLAVSEDGKVVATAEANSIGVSLGAGWVLPANWSLPYNVGASKEFLSSFKSIKTTSDSNVIVAGILADRSQQAFGRSIGWPSISPDCKYVVFFNRSYQNLPQIEIYETQSGRLVKQFPANAVSHESRFTRDGRYLVTDLDAGQLFDATGWTPVRHLGSGELCDVSGDSAVALYRLPGQLYRLVEIATGRELVRLEDPERFAGRAVFTPDGTGFVAWALDGFRVWDLRRIRSQLAKLGLDWDAKPYVIERRTSEATQRIDVHFVGTSDFIASILGDQFKIANWYPRQGIWGNGRVVLEKLLKEHPDDHWVCFQLAVLQLYLQDEAAYRRTAQQMLERFETGIPSAADKGQDWRSPAAIMDRTAKVNLLLPPEKPEDVSRVRQVMLRAAGPDTEGEPLVSWFAVGRGMAEYRAGNYAIAEKLVRSLAQDGDPANERTLAAQLIFAMAAHRLGRVQDASERLTKVAERLLTHEQALSKPNVDWGTGWADWLICEILLREATCLVKGPQRALQNPPE